MKNQLRKILKNSVLNNKNAKVFVFELKTDRQQNAASTRTKNAIVINKNILKFSKLFSEKKILGSLKQSLLIHFFETNTLALEYVKKNKSCFLLCFNSAVFITKKDIFFFIYNEQSCFNLLRTEFLRPYRSLSLFTQLFST